MFEGKSDIRLSEFWKIHPHEKKLFQKKQGMTRVLYLSLFKWFQNYGCFPRQAHEIPLELLNHGLILEGDVLSQQGFIKLFGQKRLINRYKQEIRDYFGFKRFSEQDDSFQTFLLENIFKEKNEEVLHTLLCDFLKKYKIEIPSKSILEEVCERAKTRKESLVFKEINKVLSEEHKTYIDSFLLSPEGEGDKEPPLQFLRQPSGKSSRANVKEEIQRLELMESLPMEKFNFIRTINIKYLNYYKRRFLTDTPDKSKRRPDIERYALVILYCYQRYQEILDNLVDHLGHFIQQIKKTAKKKEENLNREIGKKLKDLDALYQIAEINRDNPKSVIEQAVYPTIPQETINEIIRTKNYAKKANIIIQETVIRRYSNSYRSIIFEILDCLKIQSNNTEFMKGLDLVQSYRTSKLKYYPLGEDIPIEGLISKKEQKNILEKEDLQETRVLRKAYECAIFKLLRTKLNHKEVWVQGSFKYRDPVEDLPRDFEDNKEFYYELLGMPLCKKEFVKTLKEKMAKKVRLFDREFPKNEYVKIVYKKGKAWILLSPLQKIEEPKIIQNMKEAIHSKWGMIDLLDVLKEVDLRENFTSFFTTAGKREALDPEHRRIRLLLCQFGLGTNTGLKRTSGASKGLVTFEELRHIKKFYINKEDLREAINHLINKIFKMRNPKIWKSVSTACADDSKQFGCYTQNLMSQWSPRHHDDGVMIYWHVNDQYLCVYSQLKTCTSSEVASMLQGIVSQETDMEIEYQYVDSHGKSELGFALSYLEKFHLLPRYKTIGNQRLYIPSEDFEVENIKEITTRAINWQLIEGQYDEMVKHAVALKIGTSTADTLIRKFARTNYQHPTFKAFIELGKAVKTIFLCNYLGSVKLRQQINAGLNVVENWNSANDFVFYGKSGEMTTNNREDQELSMLCLHLIQTCISYVNTLLIENLFQESFWVERLKEEDYRALTPLFYLHLNPYGTFEVDLTKRLNLPQRVSFSGEGL